MKDVNVIIYGDYNLHIKNISRKLKKYYPKTQRLISEFKDLKNI